MKLIAYYSGSDARWLTCLQPTDIRKIPYILATRVRAWILKWFVDEYLIPDKYLSVFIKQIDKKAKFRIEPSVLKYNTKVPKKHHKGFNILYYYPKNEYNKKYCQWCYGIDVIAKLKEHYGSKVNWVRVDGTYDLNTIFPIIDFYVRPNRHDGDGRLGRECKIQDIPTYWSQSNPILKDIITMIDKHINMNKMFKCLYGDFSCTKYDRSDNTLHISCTECEYYEHK